MSKKQCWYRSFEGTIGLGRKWCEENSGYDGSSLGDWGGDFGISSAVGEIRNWHIHDVSIALDGTFLSKTAMHDLDPIGKDTLEGAFDPEMMHQTSQSTEGWAVEYSIFQ